MNQTYNLIWLRKLKWPHQIFKKKRKASFIFEQDSSSEEDVSFPEPPPKKNNFSPIASGSMSVEVSSRSQHQELPLRINCASGSISTPNSRDLTSEENRK